MSNSERERPPSTALELWEAMFGKAVSVKSNVYTVNYKEFIKLIDAYVESQKREAVKRYEDDLLSTIDDISNKPWRAARHIKELYKNTESGLEVWYSEVASDWYLLEMFFSNGGMNMVREMVLDPKFNVNYPEYITEFQSTQQQGGENE